MQEEKKATSNSSVVRVHKSKNFTVISNEALFEKPPLSLEAKGLLCFMLALPEDWNYSIDGLVAICKEGRHSIKSTLGELKKRGYLTIEKIPPNKSKSGRFEYIYHIYETKQNLPKQGAENQPLELEKQEVENQPLEIQAPEIQTAENQTAEIQELENQPNNKELIKEELTTNGLLTKNELTLVNPGTGFTPDDLFNLYKQICKSFKQPKEFNAERRKKATTRLKNKPDRAYWEKVFNNAENSKFCKSSNWFCFDWVVKNNLNPQKVFEGNYSDKKATNIVQMNISANNTGGKYSKCYQ